MKPVVIKIPVDQIHDWPSFHTVFAETLGFPGLYGRTLDGWIDCMSSIDSPEDGMSAVHGNKEAGMLLDLGECTEFAQRCPQQYEAILDCVGFVNYRRMEIGEEPVLSLSFYNRKPLK